MMHWFKRAFGLGADQLDQLEKARARDNNADQKLLKKEEHTLPNEASPEQPSSDGETGKYSKSFGRSSDGSARPSSSRSGRRGGRSRGRRAKETNSGEGNDEQPSDVRPWQREKVEIPIVPDKTRFLDLPLDNTLLRAICDLKFEYCSPIQAQILPETLKGKIGRASCRERV